MAVILRPGRNEEGWSRDVRCEGEDDSPGCGALIRVTKDDLFAYKFGETALLCPCCGMRVLIDEPFTDLPSEQTWRDTHPDPQQEAEEETRRAQATVYHGC